MRVNGKDALDSRSLIGVLGLFLSIFLMATDARISSVDDKIMFDMTKSILATQSFASSEPLSDRDFFIDPWFYVEGKDGKAYSKYGPGQPLAILPLYVLGKVAVSLIPAYYVDWFPSDYVPFKRPERISASEHAENVVVPAFTSLLNPLATAVSCLLVFLIAYQLSGSAKTSLVTAGIFGFATAAFPYAKYSFHHPLATALLLASFYFLLSWRARGNAWRLVIAGTCLGFATLTRYESVAALIAFLPYVAWGAYRRTGTEVFKAAMLFVLPVIAFVLVVLWYNDLRFGNPLYTGYFQEGFTADFGESIKGLILSPGRSIFLFSPPILVGLACLPLFSRRWLPEGLAIAVLVVVFFSLYAKWSGWEGGWGWGPRYLLPVLPFLIVPVLTALQSKRTWPKVVVIGLSLVGLPIQLLGVLTNFNDFYMERTMIQGLDFWRTVYDWEQSPIPGHIEQLGRGMVDPWFLRLILDSAPLTMQALAFIPVTMLVASLLLIRRCMTEQMGSV